MATHQYDRNDVINILMQTVNVERGETEDNKRVDYYSIVIKNDVPKIAVEVNEQDPEGSKTKEQIARRGLASMALKEIDAP